MTIFLYGEVQPQTNGRLYSPSLAAGICIDYTEENLNCIWQIMSIIGDNGDGNPLCFQGDVVGYKHGLISSQCLFLVFSGGTLCFISVGRGHVRVLENWTKI